MRYQSLLVTNCNGGLVGIHTTNLRNKINPITFHAAGITSELAFVDVDYKTAHMLIVVEWT